MAAKLLEKIIFGAALLVLLSSATWLLLQQSKLNALGTAPVSTGTPAVYLPAGIDAPTVITSTWPTPPAQTRGPLWIYDVFTPPEIYYDAATKEFSVTPPLKTPVTVVEPPFGIELLRVKPDVFRLQLVGYVGTAGSYQGTFENTVTGDTFLGKSGKKIPGLGLTIRDFEVKRNRVPAPDSMPIFETVATAVIVDDQTGDQVTLNNKERRTKGTPIAVFKATEGGQLFEQKAGTTFTAGSAHYTVNSVVLEPAFVQVTKQADDVKLPVIKTLVVAPPVVPPPAVAKPETSKSDPAPVAPVSP